ncbi:MAG: Gfo/Idh/MocA family oxidoreductase [Oscillospiraceae bacterium]|nr:Gfo/Idh/MocA family oxidoreductase [Oscillospiraceae bacterium]
MSEKKFGIVVIGYGGMGSRHCMLLSQTECVEVKGVYDILEEKNEAARQKGFFAYGSYEAVLADPAVDIVLVAIPNHLHKGVVLQALEAGKNVICEKPVTLSSKDLQDILDTAERVGKQFTVHQNRRWDGDFRAMKQIFDSKILGRVFNIESRVQGSRGIPSDWRTHKEFGGGMVLDWGVHLLDQLLQFDPFDKIKKVYCQLSYLLGNDCDDGMRAVLTFESGMTALVEVGTCHFDALPRFYMNGVIGTATIQDWQYDGRLVKLIKYDTADAVPVETAAGLTKTMAPRTEDELLRKPIPSAPEDVKNFYRNYCAALEGKEEIIVKNSEVMRVMKLMEACFRSYETGNAVDFE